jgi:hypothetical protein
MLNIRPYSPKDYEAIKLLYLQTVYMVVILVRSETQKKSYLMLLKMILNRF